MRRFEYTGKEPYPFGGRAVDCPTCFLVYRGHVGVRGTAFFMTGTFGAPMCQRHHRMYVLSYEEPTDG